MRRLFVDPAALKHEPVQITGPDHHHLVNVLRCRPGEPIVLLDGEGHACQGTIQAIDRRALTIQIDGDAPVTPEPAVAITVGQAVGKGDRFEQALMHATEAGAEAFLPLITERTVARIEARDVPAKLARWHQVVKGASEQSCRPRIPRIEPLYDLAAALDLSSDYVCALMLHPDGERLRDCLPSRPEAADPGPILVLIGPEGGFAPVEVAAARATGVRIASLGPYVLRTETAAIVAVSRILHHYER